MSWPYLEKKTSHVIFKTIFVVVFEQFQCVSESEVLKLKLILRCEIFYDKKNFTLCIHIYLLKMKGHLSKPIKLNGKDRCFHLKSFKTIKDN